MYLAPQNIPHAVSVLTPSNTVILYCVVYCIVLEELRAADVCTAEVELEI